MLNYAYNRLLVTDFRTAFLFYRDVLGFTPTYGDENDVYADFETGSTNLALFRHDLMAEAIGEPGQSDSAPFRDKTALIFRVENVDTTYYELQAKGVTFLTQPEDRTAWGIRAAHFRDTEGNLLEIYSPLPS